MEPTTPATGTELVHEPSSFDAVLHNPETWIAVAFLIFAGIFLKFVWPRIAGLLDDRSAKIKDQLEQASRLRAEAETLLAAYQSQREAKEKEAEEILHAAKRDAETLRERASADLKQALERRQQQALEKISRAEQDATAFIRSQMIDVASEAASQIVRTQLESTGSEDPSIARALEAISRQIH